MAARVFEPTQAELPPEQDAALRQEQLDELDGWCAALPVTGARPRTLLLDGAPPDALLAAAAAERAALLVVGGRGAGGFTNLHLGSVAHHLVHNTELPLAVIPPQGDDPVERLVVGVDGSPGSARAVDFCAALARALDVVVTAVHALEPVREWLPGGDRPSEREGAATEVRSWAKPIEDAGVALTVDVREDNPVAALASELAARPGSTAVVGARGLGGFTGLRLGRVPLQLVHHTEAAVVVVPAPSTA